MKPRSRNNYGEARILHWMLGKTKKKCWTVAKRKRMACNLIPKLTSSPSHRNIHKKSSHQAQTSDKKNPENKSKNCPKKNSMTHLNICQLYKRKQQEQANPEAKNWKACGSPAEQAQNQYTCNWTYLQAPSSVAAFPFSTATRHNTTRHEHRLPTCTCTSVKAKTKVEKKKEEEKWRRRRRKPLNLVGDCLYENQTWSGRSQVKWKTEKNQKKKKRKERKEEERKKENSPRIIKDGEE